jgi:hypothetical protein
MPALRSLIVDEAITPWYHCISRCVRRAKLCGAGLGHRKQWIENRLRELVGIFSVECAGFALMDSHLHVLLRLDSARANAWSDEEVACRWYRLFPVRDIKGTALPITKAWISHFRGDKTWVATIRTRLANLSWFMKSLKEPLARLANHEDGCSGAFWEGRFKSIAVLDEQSLLATAAYIDLNPVAAGVAATPEDSVHTSLRTRLDHCQANGTAETLRDDLSTLTRNPSQEAGLWLMPVDDDRVHGGDRAGMIEGCTLSCYLRVVDATGRMIRDGKASIEADLAPIFERLGMDQVTLQTVVTMLFQPRERIPSRLGVKVGVNPRAVSGRHRTASGSPAASVQSSICPS